MRGISIADDVKLVIYNIKGQKIKTFPITLSSDSPSDVILSGVEGTSGNFKAIWNGTNDSDNSAASAREDGYNFSRQSASIRGNKLFPFLRANKFIFDKRL